MIKLLIVANLRHKELGDFLKEKGSFEIAGCYNSLSENAVNIQHSILKVDKTLYLYQPDKDSSTNIRADMQCLQDMILNNSFFVPGEITFLTGDDEQSLQAQKYFISVMEEVKYEDFTVQSFDSQISLSAIYNTLMGISLNTNFKNTYNTLWRAERNSDSSFAYESKDDSNLILEPFTFEDAKRFESQKELVTKMSANMEFRDVPFDEIEQIPDPKLGRLDFTDQFSTDTLVCLLTGKSKSGLSTWTTILATSARMDKNRVLVLDYTSNRDIGTTFNRQNVKFTFLSMKDMLNDVKNNAGLILCGIRNDNENEIKINFVKKILREQKRYDAIFIVVDFNVFSQVHSVVSDYLTNVVLTTTTNHADVIELQQFINLLHNDKVSVILNDYLTDNPLSAKEVKDALIFYEPKVISANPFASFKNNNNLYKRILQD